MTLAEKVLAVALSQEGVEEQPRGSNGGPEVNQYLKSVGLGSGYPWCMAFVYWCMQEATAALGVKNELTKTGGVLVQWRTTGMKKVLTTEHVRPGAIFIMDFGHGFGHTGFVVSVDGNKVHTIEGNTNDQGSREGYTVARKIRTVTSIKGFLIPQ